MSATSILTEGDTNTRTYNFLDLPEGFDLLKFTSFIHRFMNGIPIYNIENFDKIRLFFKTENYFKLMKRIAVNKVDIYYEDVVGNLENNQFEVAAMVARTILLETIKAYIFHKKTSIDRDKWIPLKIKNLSDFDIESAEIYRQFKRLFFEAKLDDEKSLKNNAEEILSFSNEIILNIGNEGGI